MSRAFTIIELLMTISVIALLIALILPALAHARERGRDAVCKMNFHSFGYGLNNFAIDHQDHLPGVYSWYSARDWQKDWLSGNVGIGWGGDHTPIWNAAPEAGTLFPYVSTPKSYRCPSLRAGELNDGLNSNGKYDYTMIGLMGGARLSEIPNTMHIASLVGQSGWANPYNKIGRVSPVPFFVEESPRDHLNRLYYAGSFAWTDVLGYQHDGNCNFAAVDGSAHRFPRVFAKAQGRQLIMIGHGYTARLGIHVGRDPQRFNEWNWVYTH